MLRNKARGGLGQNNNCHILEPRKEEEKYERKKKKKKKAIILL